MQLFNVGQDEEELFPMQQPHLVSVRTQAKLIPNPTLKSQAPSLYLPATICNGFNSGNSLVVEQADQPGGGEGGDGVNTDFAMRFPLRDIQSRVTA